MTDSSKLRDTAINLMQMALACLDEAGETDAAVRLQHAISIASREQPLKEGELLEDESISLRTGGDLSKG